MKKNIKYTLVASICFCLLSNICLAKNMDRKKLNMSDYKKLTAEKLAKKYDSKELQELNEKFRWAYMAQDINTALLTADELIKKAPELYLGYDAASLVLYKFAFYMTNVENSYKQALEYCDLAIKYAPSDMNYINLYGRKADLYYQLSDYEKALEYYTKAINEGVKNHSDIYSLSEFYLKRADMYAVLKDYNKSSEDYQRPQKELDGYFPQSAREITNIKIIELAKTGENHKIHLKNFAQDSIMGVFLTFQLQGNQLGMKSWIDHSNIAFPDSALVYYLQGEYDRTAQKYADAIKNYDKAIEKDSNFARAYQGKIDVYVKQKDYEKALIVADFCIKNILENISNAYFQKAQIYKKQGQLKKAKENFLLAKEWGFSETNVRDEIEQISK